MPLNYLLVLYTIKLHINISKTYPSTMHICSIQSNQCMRVSYRKCCPSICRFGHYQRGAFPPFFQKTKNDLSKNYSSQTFTKVLMSSIGTFLSIITYSILIECDNLLLSVLDCNSLRFPLSSSARLCFCFFIVG